MRRRSTLLPLDRGRHLPKLRSVDTPTYSFSDGRRGTVRVPSRLDPPEVSRVPTGNGPSQRGSSTSGEVIVPERKGGRRGLVPCSLIFTRVRTLGS